MQTLEIGEIAPIKTTWWDKNNVPTNPTAIVLTITKPDGTLVNKTKVDMHQGATTDIWIYDQLIDQAGAWRVLAVGTVGTDTVKQDDVFLAGVDENTGPCEPWCTWDDVTACATPPTLSPAARELVLDQATEILYNLSGQKYPGLCTVTRSLCFACQACFPSMCSCVPYPSVDLSGRFPVWAAYDVYLDGVLLAPAKYTVRDRRWLVRLDGQVWPTGWNSMDPDDFRVSWVYGQPVPLGGKAAAASFALQIAKLCAGDKTCQLPQRVTQINREGISYTILDPMTMIAEGRTGLADIDLWLEADKVGSKPKPHIYHPGIGATARLR